MRLSFRNTILILLPLIYLSCTKDVITTVSDNNAPLVDNVPVVKIENYINRLFIDLIGREPLDIEMQQELTTLRADELSKESRLALIVKLQTSQDFVAGDTSYHKAYHQHLYSLAKVRLLEGASDEKIGEFSDGNDDGEAVARINAVLSAKRDMETGIITYDVLLARMIHNLVYDAINMNSFNFINAAFDNLLWRYPTGAEMDAAYTMVENNNTANLFSENGTSKADFVNILTTNKEMFEGIIISTYQTLLARRPTTEETATLLNDFFQHKDVKLIQQEILVTNEYANF